jgi:hypothetical protein
MESRKKQNSEKNRDKKNRSKTHDDQLQTKRNKDRYSIIQKIRVCSRTNSTNKKKWRENRI